MTKSTIVKESKVLSIQQTLGKSVIAAIKDGKIAFSAKEHSISNKEAGGMARNSDKLANGTSVQVGYLHNPKHNNPRYFVKITIPGKDGLVKVVNVSGSAARKSWAVLTKPASEARKPKVSEADAQDALKALGF